MTRLSTFLLSFATFHSSLAGVAAIIRPDIVCAGVDGPASFIERLTGLRRLQPPSLVHQTHLEWAFIGIWTLTQAVQYIIGLIVSDETYVPVAAWSKLAFSALTILTAIFTPYGSSTLIAVALFPNLPEALLMLWSVQGRTKKTVKGKGKKNS